MSIDLGNLAGSLNKTPMAFLSADGYLKQHTAPLEPDAMVFVHVQFSLLFLGKTWSPKVTSF